MREASDNQDATVIYSSNEAVPFDYPKEYIVSYAQTHEDVLLYRALQSVDSGFYIDVGAHDPTVLSVTRAFYDRGWQGINIEPDPVRAEKLRQARPRDITLQVAVGNRLGEAKFYDFGDTGYSTLVKEIADTCTAAAGIKSVERQILLTTLSEVTATLGNQQVHFLKIDVEGYEREVIEGADFKKVRPWIVLVEATRPMTPIFSWMEWEPLLINAGYDYVYFDGLNRFYLARERGRLRKYFSVPVSLFDPFHDSKVMDLSEAISVLETKLEAKSVEVHRLGNLASELGSRITKSESDRVQSKEDAVRFQQEFIHLSEVIMEGDKVNPTNEISRLSCVIDDLTRDKLKHEVPRLGGSRQPVFARGMSDPIGLLRIIEAQASDLVRLRRALVAARTIASERLQHLKNHQDSLDKLRAEATACHEISAPSSLLGASADLKAAVRREILRAAVKREIIKIEEQISAVVTSSRWRRLGRHIGLAKTVSWELSEWRASKDKDWEAPEATDIWLEWMIQEQQRLLRYRAELQQSRWRKLGQRIGLAKKLYWEKLVEVGELSSVDAFLGMDLPDALFKRCEDVAVANTAPPTDVVPKPIVHPKNCEQSLQHLQERFVEECRNFAVDVLFDVGAKRGRFGQEIRKSGYHGPLVSFEPLSAAHAVLTNVAASDPLWEVVERCAVGSTDGFLATESARDSYRPLRLPTLSGHRDAASESEHEDAESFPVLTLDSFIERTFSDPTTTIGLKIETHSNPAEIFAGLDKQIFRVKVIICEMPLLPLHLGSPTMPQVCDLLSKFDFHCVALGLAVEAPGAGDVLRVDGVFVRKEACLTAEALD